MTTPTTFAELALAPTLCAGLDALAYTQLTPIQAQALPAILEGRDVVAQAPTGSGKTAAFGLGLLHKIDPAAGRTQALVLCPTRELADQVGKQLRKLATGIANLKLSVLCGGIPLAPQLASLAHAPQVVVGTPGRVLELVEKGALDLRGIRTLVLDEADRMLDMGFADEIKQVLKHCPAQRQTLMFSATYPEGVQALATRFMRQPQTVTIKETHAPEQIRQLFIEVTETQRLHAVSLLLKHHRPVSTLAFCNTKQQCRDLVAVLQAQGISALELHGDLDQRDRDQVLVRFANRSCSVLVATDVAARGLDIAQLEAVINVDISPEVEVHTHRVGRTGRAGETGLAVSLASMDEMGRVGSIEHAQGRAFEWLPLAALQAAEDAPPPLPPMVTLQILGGRKEKIRPGDVLGALTKDLGLDGAQIGKISINEFSTYVAVAREIAPQALRGLSAGKVKGRSVKVRQL